MRVDRVEVIPYRLPFREPYVTARGTLTHREMALLRVHAEDGHEGLGEAVPLTLRGGSDLEHVTERLREAASRLVGLDVGGGGEPPVDVAIATIVELTRIRRPEPPVVAALESAVFDLAAQAAGVPVWQLLGAREYRPVECNATLVADGPDAVAEQALRWAERGFTTFKLKAGVGDDAGVARAVREAVGANARIRLDANEAWNTAEAVATLRALEPVGIELAEQPVAGLRGMARVAAESPIALAADESVTSVADAHRARQRRACSYATIKLSKVGGTGAADAIARVMPSYLSSALDGPVGIAAAGHAAQVLRERDSDPGLAHGLATQLLFSESIANRGCEIRDGHLHLPDGPGLGVELDEDALAGHRLDAG